MERITAPIRRLWASGRNGKIIVAVGSLLSACVLCSLVTSIIPGSPRSSASNIAALTAVPTVLVQQTALPISTQALAGVVQIQPTKSAAATPSASLTVAPKPTGTQPPTATFVPPTATRIPPTAVPSPVQAPSPVIQRPDVKDPGDGSPPNPWGYNITSGSYIYKPPANFCFYYKCIKSFWDGDGYVVKCADDQYSKSGGKTGVCSQHGGDKGWRPLYAP